jgi:hypothetical protein
MVYATALLLCRRSHVVTFDARTFFNNGASLLLSVLQQYERLLHKQAYLPLSVHALHQSSTKCIITLTSTVIGV